MTVGLGLLTILIGAWGEAIKAAPPPTPASDNAQKAAPPPAVTGSSTAESSLVKVFATVRYPDTARPWSKQPPSEISGSGVVIEGRRILTCAHVVLYASQIQVQANQAGDKLSANIDAVGPGIDLAVLKLDDESFFDSHPALVRDGNLPNVKDAVMAYGYPTGGSNLSITKGIVSRIDFVSYSSATAGLRIQIDAAVNPGNSGGPAVVGDRMIGLAFSHLGGAENIGYIIPSEEIDLFLKDIADGHYDGKPSRADEFQTLENPALRSYLKVDKSVEGPIVYRPYGDEPSYPLKKWDVVSRIGTTPIDDQGMVKIGDGLRVWFEYLVQKIAKQGKVPLTIVRNGKTLTVEHAVTAHYPTLVPDLDGAYPSYFVYGPLVFSTNTNYFQSSVLGGKSGRTSLWTLAAWGSPLVTRVADKPAFSGENLVVVSAPFLPHKLAKGYSNPATQVIKSINGIRIKNLAHLVEVLRDAKDQFIVVEFDSRHAETQVFPRAEMLAATEDILTDNGIRSQGSPDTLAIWTAKR